jgi:hypothetical protein
MSLRCALIMAASVAWFSCWIVTVAYVLLILFPYCTCPH